MTSSHRPNGPLHVFILKCFYLLGQLQDTMLAMASCLQFNVLKAHMSMPSVF